MMIRAYNNCYLEDAMSGIGAMLDYAVRICGQDLELFWARFLASGVADQFSRRNPRYLCGLSGTELALKVAVDTGDSLPVENAEIDIGSPEYWTGIGVLLNSKMGVSGFQTFVQYTLHCMRLICPVPCECRGRERPEPAFSPWTHALTYLRFTNGVVLPPL